MPRAKIVHVTHDAKENDAFRSVLFTGDRAQLVVMSLRPGEDIGQEVHADVDQILYVVAGDATAVIEDEESPFAAGSLFFVPRGTRHNVKNTGDEPLKLFTVYAPPQHADGTVHRTKADALKEEAPAPA